MDSLSITKADTARAAGLSRAAVTRWFRRADAHGWINVESTTLARLAENLHMPIAQLLTPLPPLAPYRTTFLWDALYPSMERFLWALQHKRPEALARLVQVLGFFAATRIVGRCIVAQFSQYKRFIKPARRRELETLWTLYHPST
jgi:transcriptional regulator with XRE-family HTH domain